MLDGLPCIGASLASALGLHNPLAQWVSVAPAVAIGGGLGQIAPGTPGAWRALSLLGVLLGAVLIPIALLGDTETAIPNLVGLSACVVAWGLAHPATPRLRTWSQLTLGIYLLHPLIAWRLGAWAPEYRWFETVLVAAAALVLTQALRFTPLRRVL